MDEHLEAVLARLEAVKVTGVDLLRAGILAFRALWPECIPAYLSCATGSVS